MPKSAAFDLHHERYARWFDHHRDAYVSELLALRSLIGWHGRGLEIGVGTGRFAAPLGVPVGLDPSHAMLAVARERGVTPVAGVAETLPFRDSVFDFAVVVTTICFVDSAQAMLAEARRVIRPGGRLVIGFIDRDSQLGHTYLERQSESVFYRDAVFFSAGEIDQLLRHGGFTVHTWSQTLLSPPAATTEVEPVRAGTGTGAFVVVSAEH
jgi:SAM-dependent methyltransferase